MKTRSSFVSNSSSSSFCIFGVSLKELPEEMEANCPFEAAQQAKLELYPSEYSDNEKYFIGLSPKMMHDTETLAEFKLRISDSINAMFKKYGGKTKKKKYEIAFYSGEYAC